MLLTHKGDIPKHITYCLSHTHTHIYSSPSHLSPSPTDDCFLYMLEHGFNEDQITPQGQTCLLLAVMYGRAAIIKELLADGLETNVADYSGLTCLQSACQQGACMCVCPCVLCIVC